MAQNFKITNINENTGDITVLFTLSDGSTSTQTLNVGDKLIGTGEDLALYLSDYLRAYEAGLAKVKFTADTTVKNLLNKSTPIVAKVADVVVG